MTVKANRKHHPSIRATVLTFFTLATTLTAALAIGLQYYFGQKQAKESARTLYTVAASSVANEIQTISARNDDLIALLADNPALEKRDWESQIPVFANAMSTNPIVHSVYLGHDNGDFYQLINLDISAGARQAYRASPKDRWVGVTVKGIGPLRKRTYTYFDEHLEPRSSRRVNSEYDPRQRSWFMGASESGITHSTAPYLFDQLKEPGRTVSRRVGSSDTVVAFDITLRSMSEFLSNQAVAEFGELLIYTAAGEVVASSQAQSTEVIDQLPLPALTLSAEERALVDEVGTLRVSNELDWPPLDFAISGRPDGYAIDLLRIISAITGLELQFLNGLSWKELTELFANRELDILHPVFHTEEREDGARFSEAFINLSLALATREGQPEFTSLSQLNGKKLSIPTGWTILEPTRSGFPEIEIVEANSSLHALQLVLAGEADAALDSEIILRYLEHYYYLEGLQFHSDPDTSPARLPTSLHLLVHDDRPELLALLNRAISAIGPEQHEHLEKKWLVFERPKDGASIGSVPHNEFLSIANDPRLQNELLEVDRSGESFYAYATAIQSGEDEATYFGVFVSEQSIVGPFMEKVFLSIMITGGFLLVLTPFSWFFANPIVRPIRQLALENDKIRERRYEEVGMVATKVRELDELSESMVEMVESIRAYELAQRKLMDSFIQLIAQAIDDKSAYTGGHCERVPELALMLAKQASESEAPPFNGFNLASDDQWREYRIAAWLHDCGKITTPEHIVDKGSKLEVIYNRIHEVRMRFEVLWREVEIDYLKRAAENPEQQEALRAELDAARVALQDDFEFIAECNVGGEFLDEDKQARLKEIGQRTWERYFPDRIGLSPVEELRLNGNAPDLPVTESLLQDKPEHIIERTRSTDYPPEFGIDMNIPEHLYNQGEIYNLSISRGTLTAEDRFKINEHMISTIKMLESLPFPEELKNVPRYASTHHETMRGDGYPRRLPGDELSIPERILAVADVFEALTASDRPYKKAKPVSVAIDILHKMVEDKHIDRDCFELFLRSGTYAEYASTYLDPGQVDEVDIDKYLNPA